MTQCSNIHWLFYLIWVILHVICNKYQKDTSTFFFTLQSLHSDVKFSLASVAVLSSRLHCCHFPEKPHLQFDSICIFSVWFMTRVATNSGVFGAWCRLLAMTREAKMKELQMLDTARRKFMSYTQQQKEAELARLDDEIRRKVWDLLTMMTMMMLSCFSAA